ncbi:hypothetical protein P154DRAFT_526325 [Amniculicola lignicola CBS 123094]|uniref:Uncharacterized protein n=1 Tax=Amniculicola lignicola CBS 123094 TaxID=1392246 RepID=A0A6A5W123_9PLEO|nr:hypothetical protein P154DRAFT_526325 [Amniculicola lignicola CBS 123094]
MAAGRGPATRPPTPRWPGRHSVSICILIVAEAQHRCRCGRRAPPATASWLHLCLPADESFTARLFIDASHGSVSSPLALSERRPVAANQHQRVRRDQSIDFFVAATTPHSRPHAYIFYFRCL